MFTIFCLAKQVGMKKIIKSTIEPIPRVFGFCEPVNDGLPRRKCLAEIDRVLFRKVEKSTYCEM